MKLTHLPSEFQKALPILQKIRLAGYEAYFVGGSVRDALLNRPIHDVDIATSSYPEEIKQIFKRTVDIGIEHGTVLVLEDDGEYEITTFRTEEVYVDYRRPSQVNFVRSLDEDLKRRDFTVNAFALDQDGEVIDHFGGLSDLEDKILRAVGEPQERFSEDALRILRGLRFLASLDFRLEERTFSAMKSHAYLLEKISVERSFIELDKLLLAPFWKKGLHTFVKCEAYRYLPQLQDKASALLAMTEEMELPSFDSSTQAWAALLLQMNCQHPKDFLKAWKTSSHFQKEVTAIMTIYKTRLVQSVDRRLLYQYGRNLVYLAERLRKAKGLSVDYESIDTIYLQLPIYDKREIVVNGADLIKQIGLRPGPSLGQHLSAVELAIVDGDLANDQHSILEFVRRRQDE
ncbi:CCA tRNA nucleotidyltransferase [Streptococcus sciuri]|uniref:CCA-adding enzyme n=1 Tax=Streptococcus sciuri TaxID=2973939 RepID=A0ABT2F8X2_9STRE|nr:CCA tRNA nucleotidyltransferase [Streptococcus sciuri]MCS4488280.1 CCA tRNA nucleotidyltransferase [Streptococcus sciuri]